MSAHDELAVCFSQEHPERVAELVETAPTEELAAFLVRLPPSLAASLVARAVPTAIALALAKLEPDAAAAILRELNPRLAAALLRRLEPPMAQALLGKLPRKVATQIENLAAYRPDQVASRVDPRAPAVSQRAPVEHAFEVVRQAADAALHYVYVLDEEQKLVGVASMRELMTADPKDSVADIMVRAPQRLVADDPLDAAVAHPGWRKVHALPVVDGGGRFLGVIRYSEFRLIEAEAGKARSSGSRGQTSSALAELFWFGAAAMLRLGEAAVLGGPGRQEESS